MEAPYTEFLGEKRTWCLTGQGKVHLGPTCRETIMAFLKGMKILKVIDHLFACCEGLLLSFSYLFICLLNFSVVV